MIPPSETPSAPRVRAIPAPGVTPVFTYVIMAVTILVYLGQLTFQDPFTIYGVKVNELIRRGEYWRFITPIFFHSPTSPLHIFFNMYALFNVGKQIERPLGYARFLMIYFFSGIAGVFASFLFTPSYSLGASGAVFGLIGALAVFLYRHTRLLGPVGRSMLSNVVFIIVMNLAISFSPGIDLWGHVGGLAAGAALAWLLGPDWKLELDPYTGNPHAVDRHPLSRHLPLAFFLILAAYLAALWLIVR
ncbi:MAG: rhomboid family intramembrane serine protease [Anaerolineales bacterium]|nr:rhomboid family intramembrane serine protease [Anaerolineales bacterium]